MFKNVTIILLCFLVQNLLTCGQLSEPDEREEKIDSILQSYYSSGEFNGCVLVVENGKEIINKAYGYENEGKDGLLTADHQFGIGSIYKEFPAVLIMRLSEEGSLKLDDKIDQYFPDLPEWSKSISILDLLRYTSGLPMIQWNTYFSKNIAVNEELIMNDLVNLTALEFAPGSDYLYTNNSPFLLIKIIEKLENQAFPEVVQNEFFTPLGMNNTAFKSQFPYENTDFMAIPFNAEFEADQYGIAYPSILLTTTTRDLSVWIEKLNSFEIVDESSVLTLTKTASLELDDMQAPLGNCIIRDGGIQEHQHHGSMGNYEGLVTRNNEEGWTIVLLTNQKNKNVFEITEQIKAELQKVN